MPAARLWQQASPPPGWPPSDARSATARVDDGLKRQWSHRTP